MPQLTAIRHDWCTDYRHLTRQTGRSLYSGPLLPGHGVTVDPTPGAVLINQLRREDIIIEDPVPRAW